MSDTERLTLAKVERVIEEVEAEVLAEDKLGASRNDVVEGACQRIVRRLNSLEINDRAYLRDCADCGVMLFEGENVELSDGTYCKDCASEYEVIQ